MIKQNFVRRILDRISKQICQIAFLAKICGQKVKRVVNRTVCGEKIKIQKNRKKFVAQNEHVLAIFKLHERAWTQNYALIFGTQPFYRIYRRFRLGFFLRRSGFEGHFLPKFLISNYHDSAKSTFLQGNEAWEL